ncbi:DNA-binding response regulator [Dictyobacter alpinus]|uniref:DNA-binding response regulator n=1 Tax=Dictyobacter alpinus TaxID=2014873 RepID=A0A402BB85_9CHLR|nr:response regulator transcription factor [Dictyobacter alpinus]GCE28604.1 DNA-binding response regulator [Dictyobacter alpinus]
MQKDDITIFLVDDHSIVRQGVHAFLAAQPDMNVIGEAASGEEALKLIPDLIPHVVLMDLLMPGMGGVEAIRQMKQVSPRTQVVVLTSYHEDENIFPALRAGALSYTLKDIRLEELVDIVRRAANGEASLHPHVAARLIQEVRQTRRSVPASFAQLTERELEILRLLAEGCSNTTIAQRLVISEQTVKGHVSNILSKLHMVDRTQAAVFAWQQGLMEKNPARE